MQGWGKDNEGRHYMGQEDAIMGDVIIHYLAAGYTDDCKVIT